MTAIGYCAGRVLQLGPIASPVQSKTQDVRHLPGGHQIIGHLYSGLLRSYILQTLRVPFCGKLVAERGEFPARLPPTGLQGCSDFRPRAKACHTSGEHLCYRRRLPVPAASCSSSSAVVRALTFAVATAADLGWTCRIASTWESCICVAGNSSHADAA